MTTVGYIGLGAMGSALAAQLASRVDLIVWDINQEATRKFEAMGARVANSPEAIGAECDIVFLCLPKTDIVRELLFGHGGLAGALKVGAIVVDQTSGVAGATQEIGAALATSGISLIDAPVAGGVPSALAGQITIFTSGAQPDFDRVEPILKMISPKVFHCSKQIGDGQVLKAINNIMNAACRMMTLEVVAVGRCLGLTTAAMTQSLENSPAQSFVTYRLLPAIVEQRSSTDFRLDLMVKDLNQAADLAVARGVPTPISDTARGMIHAALNILGSNARLDDIVPFMETMTSTRYVDMASPDDASAALLPYEEAMALVTSAVAACNRIIAEENIALAIACGLEVEAFGPALESGSASSRQASKLLVEMHEQTDILEQPVSPEMLNCLTRLTDIGAKTGVPMLMANQVRARCLARGVNDGLCQPVAREAAMAAARPATIGSGPR